MTCEVVLVPDAVFDDEGKRVRSALGQMLHVSGKVLMKVAFCAAFGAFVTFMWAWQWWLFAVLCSFAYSWTVPICGGIAGVVLLASTVHHTVNEIYQRKGWN